MSCSKVMRPLYSGVTQRIAAAASAGVARSFTTGSIRTTRRVAHSTLASSSHATPLTHRMAPMSTTTVAAATAGVIEDEEYPPPAVLAAGAYLKNFGEYKAMYDESLAHPDAFWRKMADEFVTFSTPYDTVKSGPTPDATQWYVGGKLNACYNCVDRHVKTRGDKVAILWESDDGLEVRRITYSQLHVEVQRVANVLKSLGAKKGSAVTFYMPMVPEAAIAMLACARIGAMHNVVFAGFSEEALRERIKLSGSSIVITSDEMLRAGKPLGLKNIVDAAVVGCDSVKKILVVKRTGTSNRTMKSGRDVWWHEEAAKVSAVCAPEPMDSEDPLFCLFTSGSTGKPKGLVHTTAGYLTYAAVTSKYVFDIRETDVYACTADIGWITGHTYIVYGPLALGATTMMFEGHPTHPHNGRYWEMVEKHKINIFYTSPTAIRSLMRFGNDPIKKWDRSSLRVLGSVGEPINPEAWKWLHREVGESRCPIVDTYWQTETGGIIVTPLPGATTLRPGSATFPFFGIDLGILAAPEYVVDVPFVKGEEVTGALIIRQAWPGMARSILGEPARYKSSYFNHADHPLAYVTGDSARRDADGYFWIIGRMDDVINTSGHRVGSAEVESAIVTHPSAAEAAVVGMSHKIKGEALVAFVQLKHGAVGGEQFISEVKKIVATQIGKLAIPDMVIIVDALPKTRSGKIMRRLLRNLVHQKTDAASLGDTSTLADPHVVDVLIKQVNSELAAFAAKQ